MKFGRFIDDISKYIKQFELSYLDEGENGLQEVILRVPPSKRELLLTNQYIGLIKVGSPEYYQLVEVLIKQLKSFNEEEKVEEEEEDIEDDDEF